LKIISNVISIERQFNLFLNNQKICNLRTIVNSFSDGIYNDEIEESYAASEQTVSEANAIIDCFSSNIKLPQPKLFGDGSIAFIWSSDRYLAGIRLLGNQLVSCYSRHDIKDIFYATYYITERKAIYKIVNDFSMESKYA
jgi:hypothetical protein